MSIPKEELKKILAVLVGLLVLGLAVTFYLAYRTGPRMLQGQIEARQYSVSSKVAGRIADVFVQKGDRILKGQLVFSIYSVDRKSVV